MYCEPLLKKLHLHCK